MGLIRSSISSYKRDPSHPDLINGLAKAGVTVNRKMLAEIAIDSPESFKNLVELAKDALNGKKYTPKEVKAEAKEEKKEVEKKTTTKAAEKKEPAKKAETKSTTKKSTTTKKTATKKEEK